MQTLPALLSHAVPQVPQLRLSVCVVLHTPLQSVWPLGHLQSPAWQVFPFEQTVPQLPQLLLSVALFTHADVARLVHRIVPVPHARHVSVPVQYLAGVTAVAPVTLPLAAQNSTFVAWQFAAHWPLKHDDPLVQAHTPPAQDCPAAHVGVETGRHCDPERK